MPIILCMTYSQSIFLFLLLTFTHCRPVSYVFDEKVEIQTDILLICRNPAGINRGVFHPARISDPPWAKVEVSTNIGILIVHDEQDPRIIPSSNLQTHLHRQTSPVRLLQ